jgi:hypothetical protein
MTNTQDLTCACLLFLVAIVFTIGAIAQGGWQ